jgi:hypothetical protein
MVQPCLVQKDEDGIGQASQVLPAQAGADVSESGESGDWWKEPVGCLLWVIVLAALAAVWKFL